MKIAKKLAGIALAASVCSFAGPVSHFGYLTSCGKNVCGSKTGASVPIQLKGPSLFWSTGDPAILFNPITVDWFTMNFNIGVIRAPMAIKYYAENKEPIAATDGADQMVTSFGYLSTDIPGTSGVYKANTKALMKSIIDQAILNDVYVLVDWHSHNAHSETAEAANFFKELATEYKDVPNIIWEIYNEPVGAGASQINQYAQTVVSAIRGTGNKNLVIVGSSSWSSQPGQQASQGLHKNQENIAYTLHFYAGTGAHEGYKNNVPSDAPTFVTEWGASGASGDGSISSSTGWLSWMDQNKISGCMWFAGPDKQSSAMFPTGANPTNLDNYIANFNKSQNTTAGVFANFMSTNSWTTFVPSSHPMGNTFKSSVAEGASKVFSTELGIRGKITAAETNSGSVTFTDNSITFQSAPYGSPEVVYISYSVTQGDVTTKERIAVSMTDRKPILKDSTISVSYKNPTTWKLSKLGATDPLSKGTASLVLKGATATAGTVTFAGDSLTYVPTGVPGTAEIKYSVANAKGVAEATLTLVCQNQAPSIYNKAKMGTKSSSEIIPITLTTMRAKDADGDPVTFKVAYLAPGYPGSVTLNATKDTAYYAPAGGGSGTVDILIVLTDGVADSKIGIAEVVLNGGAPFSVVAPTVIPADVYTEPVIEPIEAIAPVKVQAASFKVSANGIQLSLAQSGRVTVEVFDMNGHLVKNVLNQNMVAGEHSIGWNAALPTGSYIVRMRQGSQSKVAKFLNR